MTNDTNLRLLHLVSIVEQRLDLQIDLDFVQTISLVIHRNNRREFHDHDFVYLI